MHVSFSGSVILTSLLAAVINFSCRAERDIKVEGLNFISDGHSKINRFT
jgi:hypothetical protein